MPDREKIIKGLERCLICDISVIAPEEAQNAYRECEYKVGLYCGEKKLLREAVALLKEQDTQNVVDMRLAKDWYRAASCPKCNELLKWVYHRNYCGYCGQAVKWE